MEAISTSSNCTCTFVRMLQRKVQWTILVRDIFVHIDSFTKIQPNSECFIQETSFTKISSLARHSFIYEISFLKVSHFL